MKFNETEKILLVMVAIMVVVSVIMIVQMLAVPAEAEEAVESRREYVICSKESYVYVRERPSKKGDVVAICGCGDYVDLDGVQKGDWLHVVEICGGDGWINRMYVTGSPAERKDFYAVTNDRNVRARNGVEGRVLRRLKKGTKVRVMAASDEWCVTNKGYIMTEYLTPVDELAREND